MTDQDVEFRRFNATEARTICSDVEAVYVDSYSVAIASGDPFDSVEQFMHRFDSYTSSPTFDHVVAYRDGLAIGQTWGWPLSEKSLWWSGLDPEPEPGFTREDGHRTFALSEIMVCSSYSGRGVAHALHDQLLARRTEERATLLVEPDNAHARRAYVHWGWQPVAHLRPAWDDAPQFEVLVLPSLRAYVAKLDLAGGRQLG